MTITQTYTGNTLHVTALPAGPITELRWYRTRANAGLLVVFRRDMEDAPAVTITALLGGRLRRLRVIAPAA